MNDAHAQSSFDSIFGTMNLPEEVHILKNEMKEVHIMPRMLPIGIHEKLIKEQMDKAQQEKKWVLAFVIGTKPCFYKFYGSIVEAEKQGLPYLILNSNQHYDANLTYGEKEFSYADKIACNFFIRGNLAQKSAELFTKVGWFAQYLKQHWSSVTVIPVVLGDTIMCSIVPAAWMFHREEKAIHNEAGLRSMTPVCMRNALQLSPEQFIHEQFYGNWELLTNEPFPEQWDTFVASKGSEFMFAPLELNKQHLVREGHPAHKIFVTGGVVVEALEKKMKEKPAHSIFDIYPQLASGQWIRVDIHRKENQIKERFTAIMMGLCFLLELGHKICFIEMNTTRDSLDAFGLRPLLGEMKKNPNFLHTEVWPEYANVVEFYNSPHCLAALTDSGGVQEEMNLLGKPCFTLRFNTDRPETVMEARSNILVPPVSGEYIATLVDYAVKHPTLLSSMASAKKLYGKHVAQQFIAQVQQLMNEQRKPFGWAHHDLGFFKE